MTESSRGGGPSDDKEATVVEQDSFDEDIENHASLTSDARPADLPKQTTLSPFGEQPEQDAAPPSANVDVIPDGGLVAWLQVVGTFFCYFNTWGVINMFGSYQTVYETDILSSSSPSAISWIGSIQAFLLCLVGALTGPLYDAGHMRSLILTGSVLIVLGQMMLSLATQYYQVLLAQGFAIGIGCGCIFIPGVAILSTYFDKRLSLAVGLAAAGSGIGGVVYPIMFARLLPKIGFAWTVRIIGFIALFGLTVSNFMFKVRVPPSPGHKHQFIDLTAFAELPYTLYVTGSFLGMCGLYVLYFYVEPYAIATGITDASFAFYLLAILNAASILGRIVPNYLADKVGALNMMIPCNFATGVLTLCLIPTHTVAPLTVIVAFYGFFSGSFVSLPPGIYVELTPNRAMLGTRMGMGFLIEATGLLIGTPISGALERSSGYAATWIFGGVTTLLGAVTIALARVAQRGFGLRGG